MTIYDDRFYWVRFKEWVTVAGRLRSPAFPHRIRGALIKPVVEQCSDIKPTK